MNAQERQLLTEARLRLSNFDPLARRIDAALAPPLECCSWCRQPQTSPSCVYEHWFAPDNGDPVRMISEYSYGVLRAKDDAS